MMKGVLSIFILLVGFWPLRAQVKVFALEYGRSDFLGRLIDSDIYQSQKRLPISWLCYLIKDRKNQRNILVDTGFVSAHRVKKWGISQYQPPVHLLKGLKLGPKDITDIFITHSHFDHIDGLVYFKRAKVFMTKQTYVLALKRGSPKLKYSLRSKRRANKLFFTKHQQKLFKNLTVYHTFAHAAGAQILELKTGQESYLFVGDECYRASVCRKGTNGSLYDLKNFRKLQPWLEIDKRDSRILSAHELPTSRVTRLSSGIYLLN